MTRVLAHDYAATEPPVPERVCLARVGGKTHNYDVSVMMMRVEGAQWYLANAECLLSIENLASDEVIPLLLGNDGWPIDSGLTGWTGYGREPEPWRTSSEALPGTRR